jgi:glycosyltransferase involved in cell wall biosynthesis
MTPNCTVVLTTIFDSDILDAYLENFQQYGHLDTVQVIVIPDRKTPASIFPCCADLQKQGLKVACPTLSEQEKFLARLGPFSRLVPYNSDNRRNVGFLMAYERGSDFLISIDDDNFCLPGEDFIASHSVVCRGWQRFNAAESVSGWLNVCEMLEVDPPYRVYPRGYPYRNRHRSEKIVFRTAEGSIHLNAGLWIGEPDMDAISWLTAPVQAKSLKGNSVVLGANTWSPINTQNTALVREAIPAYYFVRMGYEMAGITMDRFGDIFSGYFIQACMRHLGNWIRVGTPVAEHRRNSHNYLNDAMKELPCIWLLEEITAWLREVKLEGSNYAETYLSLSYMLDDAVERFTGLLWTDSVRGYFHQMAYCMREWLRACQVLQSGVAAASVSTRGLVATRTN